VATEHVHLVVLDLLLEKKELFLLAPVAEGLDEAGEEDSEND
jgi:hypothetical protein